MNDTSNFSHYCEQGQTRDSFCVSNYANVVRVYCVANTYQDGKRHFYPVLSEFQTVTYLKY